MGWIRAFHLPRLAGLLFGLGASPIVLGAPALSTQAKAVSESKEPSGPSAIENDPYLSVLFRNTAQHYQTRHGLGTVSGGRASLEVASNRKGFDIKNTSQRSGVEALGVYAIMPGLLSAGLSTYRIDDRSTSSVTDGTSTLDARTRGSDVNVTPFALTDIAGCVSIAGEYQFNTTYETAEGRETNTVYFQRFVPSMLYHRDTLEVGISYSPTILLREPGITHIETGTTTASGQLLIAPTVSVGGFLRQYRSSQVDREALKDNYEFNGASEVQLTPKFRLGAGLSYRTTSSATDEDATASTIPRWGPEAFVGFSPSPPNRLGLIYRGIYARRTIGDTSHRLLGHDLEGAATLRF